MRYESQTPEETRRVAGEIARLAKPGDIYALTGGLGAGKTVFAQGFAHGLGYEGAVTSPTFTLMHVYEGGRLTLYHFDLYRLHDGADDLESIGCEDYFYADGVCLIEWSERAEGLLPEHTCRIELQKDEAKGENYRRLHLSKGLATEP